jgi:hypothetical protein
LDILMRCCAGLDVHNETVVCVRRLPSGRKRRVVTGVRTLSTTTGALLKMGGKEKASGMKGTDFVKIRQAGELVGSVDAARLQRLARPSSVVALSVRTRRRSP